MVLQLPGMDHAAIPIDRMDQAVIQKEEPVVFHCRVEFAEAEVITRLRIVGEHSIITSFDQVVGRIQRAIWGAAEDMIDPYLLLTFSTAYPFIVA